MAVANRLVLKENNVSAILLLKEAFHQMPCLYGSRYVSSTLIFQSISNCVVAHEKLSKVDVKGNSSSELAEISYKNAEAPRGFIRSYSTLKNAIFCPRFEISEESCQS